jgi:hypothetical protein
MGKARSLKEARELAAELSECDGSHTPHRFTSHSNTLTTNATYMAGWRSVAMIRCHDPLPSLGLAIQRHVAPLTRPCRRRCEGVRSCPGLIRGWSAQPTEWGIR